MADVMEDVAGVIRPPGEAPSSTPRPLPPLSGLPAVEKGLGYVESGALGGLQGQRDINEQRRGLLTQQEREQAPIVQGIQSAVAEPRPAAPPAPALPPPYQREFRPFLAGTPGEDPYQSIQKALGGLALIATQAKGAFSNYPQGALAALSGALNGWAQGDQRRGDAEFENYKTRVASGLQQWQMARQEFEDALRARHATLEDLGVALKAVGIKYDLPKEMLDLAEKDVVAGMNTFGALGKTFIESGWKAEELGLKRDIAASTQQHQRDQAAALRLFQDQQQALERDRQTETSRFHTGTLGQSAASLAETTRHNQAMEARANANASAGANKVLGNDAAKWENSSGERPPATYTIAQAVSEGYKPGGKVSTAESARMLQQAMGQIQRLVPELERKGFLAGGASGLSMGLAWLQRNVMQPGDEDLGAFLAHSGTMVSALRGLGDIGPRAMAAYDGAVNLINKVQTGAAVRKGVGQIQNLLAVIAPADIERKVRVRNTETGQTGTLTLAPGERYRDLPDGMELD